MVMTVYTIIDLVRTALAPQIENVIYSGGQYVQCPYFEIEIKAIGNNCYRCSRT